MAKSAEFWTTADGRKVKIPDMTDDHLLNAIRYVERRATKSFMLIMGMDTLDTYTVEQVAGDFCSLYASMLKEIKKRKLKKRTLLGYPTKAVRTLSPRSQATKRKSAWAIKQKGKLMK